MKNILYLCLGMLFLLCPSHPIFSGGHKDIKAWRQAADKNVLAHKKNIEAMKKMKADEFKRKIHETRTSMNYDETSAQKIAFKKTYFGFFKVGLSALFATSSCLFSFKAIPSCLQLEDEQARVTATFWCSVGALASLGASYFFWTKGTKNIVNNYNVNFVQERLNRHFENLKEVEEQFNQISHEDEGLE